MVLLSEACSAPLQIQIQEVSIEFDNQDKMMMVVVGDDDLGWEQREWVYYKWAGDCSSEEIAG